jgi:hypothetical protein
MTVNLPAFSLAIMWPLWEEVASEAVGELAGIDLVVLLRVTNIETN